MSAAKAPPRYHGLLLVDKPIGFTSHDVVAKIRRLAGQKRVGHTGTLDPMATGLLAILLGSATRLEPYLTKMDKIYTGRIQLGLTTDTDDVTGSEMSRYSGPWPEAQAVSAALKARQGETDQAPPAYSAVKVDGQRAYKAARAGKPLKLAPRKVTAYGLEMTGYDPPMVDFRASVSSGYYIRSLARDLGADLSLGAALAALRRETVGPWSVKDAHTLEKAAQWDEADWLENLLSPAEALPHLPAQTLDKQAAQGFSQGRTVEILAPVNNNVDNGPIKVLNAEGRLIGLGEICTASVGGNQPGGPFLRPFRVFSAGE